MRVIDVFNHVLPATYRDRLLDVISDKGMAKRLGNIRLLHDIEARIRMMDQWPGYQQILTASPPPIELLAPADTAPNLARIANDGLAELCRKWPDKFPAFAAAVPCNNLPAAMAEIERAVTQLGARGIQIFTSINGRPLDDAEFAPLFECMAKTYDLPILLHPTRPATTVDYKTEAKSRFEIWQVLGWPHETSVAMARIVFSGMFDRLPNLKIVTHHLGGTTPYLEGRLGPLWDQLGSRTADEDYSSLLKSMKIRPVDYFRLFYGDTVIGGSGAALACGVSFFGADHVLFASDCPFDPEGGAMYIRENMRAVNELNVSIAEKEEIFSKNAVRLFKLAS
jgi:aminocarboxymuconate-semialdehyde decarboxylase